MLDLPGPLGTLVNLLAVVIGFGGIIFIHELGHFLAAKWAGIRVLAFSMGMGPVVCSYRHGIGFRKGSSEPEYQGLLRDAQGPRGDTREHARTLLSGTVSPTEYRLSALPLGGYVKMLGQEDANPGAVSDAPDSYQNRPVWKRMVVITAGVVFNLILAAVLFVIVFTAGLQTQAPIVGAIAPGMPAGQAVALGRDDIEPGLLPEDTILSINGHAVRAFNEISTEVAMSSVGKPVVVRVDRPGVGQLGFETTPIRMPGTGFLGIGIAPAWSTTMHEGLEGENRRVFTLTAERVGFVGVGLGARLVSVDGVDARSPNDIGTRAEASDGRAFPVEFESPDGQRVAATIQPERALERSVALIEGERTMLTHVLGLRGLLCVHPDADPDQTAQGLEPGDVFARIGSVEFPGYAEAIPLIRSLRGQSIELEIIRGLGTPQETRLTLPVDVTPQGTIGFLPGQTADRSGLVARPIELGPIEQVPSEASDADGTASHAPTAAHRIIDRPGTRIVAIEGRTIESLRDIPGIIAELSDQMLGADPDAPLQLGVTLALPLLDAPTETVTWILTPEELAQALSLGWQVPGGDEYRFLFQERMIVDRADTPMGAVVRGISKSRQTMMQTYLTFLRLFQGTVKIEHLKGPVGIAHLGTQVADQGLIWLLFFLGLVSVNLAVINFLPLPIVDGGQFLMLAYEGIRRKPVPIVFQNVVTLAGLVLIVSVFLIVTFHDIRALLGG